MMPNMMSGMGTYMFFWIALITLICLLIIGACVWLVARLLKKQRMPTMQSMPQPQDAFEEYEQGYRSQQQPLETHQEGVETYQEGGQRYAYPQNEPRQTQYQEMEQLQQ